jgi:hypothetical protein
MAKEVGLYIQSGWTKPMMFYQFRCDKHGNVIGYPHGHDKILVCSLCVHKKSQSGT